MRWQFHCFKNSGIDFMRLARSVTAPSRTSES